MKRTIARLSPEERSRAAEIAAAFSEIHREMLARPSLNGKRHPPHPGIMDRR